MAFKKCPHCGQIVNTESTSTCPYCNMPSWQLSTDKSNESTSSVYEAGTTPMAQMTANSNLNSPLSSVSISPSPLWNRLRVLLRLPSPPVELEGVVVKLQVHQEEVPSRPFFLEFASLLKDLLWPFSSQGKAEQKRTVTVIRLRIESGAYRDVRIEGSPSGALLTEDDKVSFWGRYRKGLLYVKRGYSHTSGAEIYSGNNQSLSSLIFDIVFIVILILAFYFFFLHEKLIMHFPL